MKFKLNLEKLFDYVRATLILILFGIEILLCAEAVGEINTPSLVLLICCCVVLLVVETVNEYVLKTFNLKMAFYAVAAVLSFVICLLTGNSYLATIYCVILTGLYVNVSEFKDRTILYAVGCASYFVSFMASLLIVERSLAFYRVFVETFSGIVTGLVTITIDYVIVQFILKYNKTNKELSAALAEADRSKAELEAAYEQLTLTRIYEERNRIAKDIHDNAGHSMTTVIMQTEAAKLLIDKDPKEAKERIISANIQAKNALEQMRESVHLLAGRGREKTLSEEIQQIIAQTMDGTGVVVRSDIAEFSADGKIKRYLCNTIKELISNGLRHGKATAFYIELTCNGNIIKLLVSDNGAGASGEIKEGFGLKGIKEKAERFGGKCCITSEKDEGFEVTVILPREVDND